MKPQNLTAALTALTLSLTAVQTLAASSFAEVRDVMLDRAVRTETTDEQAEFDVYRRGELPHYEVTAKSFIVNGINRLAERARQTTTENVDYYPRLTKLVHPNGICFTGEWVISEPTPYTGYFASGARGLFVGRASVAMSETTQGHKRGFGFAGKIFPTLDENEKVETASFFTVDVLSGTRRKTFVGTNLTNEPETGFDLGALWLGLKIAKTFSKADSNPGFRPLYPIGRLGLEAAVKQSARFPKWMRITTAPGTEIVAANDFRDELAIGKSRAKPIQLDIYVSETTKDANATDGWTRIGRIELKESAVSYGCDRQIHFAHPKLEAH